MYICWVPVVVFTILFPLQTLKDCLRWENVAGNFPWGCDYYNKQNWSKNLEVPLLFRCDRRYTVIYSAGLVLLCGLHIYFYEGKLRVLLPYFYYDYGQLGFIVIVVE